MDESWAGLFREHILPALPVRELARHFTAGFSRPTKKLFTALGLLILQQINDLVEEKTVGQFAFNAKWHYAFGYSL